MSIRISIVWRRWTLRRLKNWRITWRIWWRPRDEGTELSSGPWRKLTQRNKNILGMWLPSLFYTRSPAFAVHYCLFSLSWEWLGVWMEYLPPPLCISWLCIVKRPVPEVSPSLSCSPWATLHMLLCGACFKWDSQVGSSVLFLSPSCIIFLTVVFCWLFSGLMELVPHSTSPEGLSFNVRMCARLAAPLAFFYLGMATLMFSKLLMSVVLVIIIFICCFCVVVSLMNQVGWLSQG